MKNRIGNINGKGDQKINLDNYSLPRPFHNHIRAQSLASSRILVPISSHYCPQSQICWNRRRFFPYNHRIHLIIMKFDHLLSDLWEELLHFRKIILFCWGVLYFASAFLCIFTIVSWQVPASFVDFWGNLMYVYCYIVGFIYFWLTWRIYTPYVGFGYGFGVEDSSIDQSIWKGWIF